MIAHFDSLGNPTAEWLREMRHVEETAEVVAFYPLPAATAGAGDEGGVQQLAAHSGTPV